MLKSYLAQLNLTKEQQEYYYKCIVEIDPDVEVVFSKLLYLVYQEGFDQGVKLQKQL